MKALYGGVMKRVAVLFASVSLCVAASAEPTIEPGFDAFFNGEYESAVHHFEEQVKGAPGNAALYNHLAQALLYHELFRDGALESQLVSGNGFLRRAKLKVSPAEKAQLLATLQRAQTLSEQRLAANASDVRAWYEIGVTHGLRANYYFLVEKAWTESLRQAAAARKAEERALALDPAFADANMIPALYEYIAGSLPFLLRTLGALGGFHGDKAEGIRRLESVARNGESNKYDAQVVLAVLYRREKQSEKAVPLLQNLAEKFSRNSLYRFEEIKMYSDEGDGKAAFEILRDIERRREAKAPGYADIAPAKIQFVEGNLHFWHGDIGTALNRFQVATQDAGKLDSDTRAKACLRLGQIYDLNGSRDQAIRAYEAAVRTAPHPDVVNEANHYIANPYRHRRKAKEHH